MICGVEKYWSVDLNHMARWADDNVKITQNQKIWPANEAYSPQMTKG